MIIMDNPICISTGLLYRFTDDRNEMILKLRTFNPNGIELSFAFPAYLLNFNITEENKKYLLSLDYNSIHSPWKDIRYGDNPNSSRVLDAMKKLYDEIDARNIVFHKEQIEDFGVIEKMVSEGYTVSIENDDWKGGCNTVSGIGEILLKYPGFKFTMDFAHTYSIDPESSSVYIKEFKDKIIQVHLSLLTPALNDHTFFYNHDCSFNRRLIKELETLDVPLILECVAQTEDEIELISREMEYIRSI